MNDRAVELLEQYDIEVLRTRKGRSAIVCDTGTGCFILKEYTGNAERAELQNRLLQTIAAAGAVQTESILPTREGELLVKDGDGTAYVLKTWQDGRECNISDRGECVQAVGLLAKLHECMELPADAPGLPAPFSPEKEYEKHNRELRRVWKFLKQKGQKQQFEISLLGACDYFLNQALEVTEAWKQYSAAFGKADGALEEGAPVTFCHGDYQYHNILMGSEGWFVVNFEKCLPDDPVRDLYLLLRKLLERETGPCLWERSCCGPMKNNGPCPPGAGLTCITVWHIRKSSGRLQISIIIRARHGFPEKSGEIGEADSAGKGKAAFSERGIQGRGLFQRVRSRQ